MPSPLVVAVDMGFGHLRAAQPLAEALGTEVLHADRPPLADPSERAQWERARGAYGLVTRFSQQSWIGPAARWAVDAMTWIPPLHPHRDLSAPNAGTRQLARMIRKGLGRGLVEHLKKTGAPLLTTFYSPAIVADAAGCRDIWCVVTDTDLNRVWVPKDSARTSIRYLAPSLRARRRLLSYGVPADRVHFTGYPLPEELLGGKDLPALRKNLAGRLVRLDPNGEFREVFREEVTHFLGELGAAEGSPLLTFAIGGTGAQTGIARRFLPSFRDAIRTKKIRIALVAGIRPEVGGALRDCLREAGLVEGEGVEILVEDSLGAYFRRFNELLARTDILWTKPSEMTFFAALGLPLVLAPPVGVHERYNRRWAEESGAGFRQRDPRWAWDWLSDWLADGKLAAAAWAGFMRLPKHGLYRILEAVRASSDST